VKRPRTTINGYSPTLTYETANAGVDTTRTTWLDPEPPHSVENITFPYHAYRIELRANLAATRSAAPR
jgi:hypothetical protein